MYKWMGVPFAEFISFFLNIPGKLNNLVSLRPNYFIFIGYLKMGDKEGGSSEPPEPPLDPPLHYNLLTVQCPFITAACKSQVSIYSHLSHDLASGNDIMYI